MKKLSIFGLLAVLSASMLTGCGDSAPTTPPPAPSTNTTPAAPAAPAAPATK